MALGRAPLAHEHTVSPSTCHAGPHLVNAPRVICQRRHGHLSLRHPVPQRRPRRPRVQCRGVRRWSSMAGKASLSSGRSCMRSQASPPAGARQKYWGASQWQRSVEIDTAGGTKLVASANGVLMALSAAAIALGDVRAVRQHSTGSLLDDAGSRCQACTAHVHANHYLPQVLCDYFKHVSTPLSASHVL